MAGIYIAPFKIPKDALDREDTMNNKNTRLESIGVVEEATLREFKYFPVTLILIQSAKTIRPGQGGRWSHYLSDDILICTKDTKYGELWKNKYRQNKFGEINRVNNGMENTARMLN